MGHSEKQLYGAILYGAILYGTKAWIIQRQAIGLVMASMQNKMILSHVSLGLQLGLKLCHIMKAKEVHFNDVFSS